MFVGDVRVALVEHFGFDWDELPHDTETEQIGLIAVPPALVGGVAPKGNSGARG